MINRVAAKGKLHFPSGVTCAIIVSTLGANPVEPTLLALLVSGLGTGLIKVIETLATKGIVEPGLKPLSEILEGQYGRKKTEAELMKAVKAALETSGGVEGKNAVTAKSIRLVLFWGCK